MKKPIHTLAAALLILFTLAAFDAHAQRVVSVNGQYMHAQQLMVLDQLAGGYIPNGHYWLNTATGAWGYMGSPVVQGYIGGGGSPGDAYPGQNYRGPFGDYMSDGRCSFVNGIPVGQC